MKKAADIARDYIRNHPELKNFNQQMAEVFGTGRGIPEVGDQVKDLEDIGFTHKGVIIARKRS